MEQLCSVDVVGSESLHGLGVAAEVVEVADLRAPKSVLYSVPCHCKKILKPRQKKKGADFWTKTSFATLEPSREISEEST